MTGVFIIDNPGQERNIEVYDETLFLLSRPLEHELGLGCDVFSRFVASTGGSHERLY